MTGSIAGSGSCGCESSQAGVISHYQAAECRLVGAGRGRSEGAPLPPRLAVRLACVGGRHDELEDLGRIIKIALKTSKFAARLASLGQLQVAIAARLTRRQKPATTAIGTFAHPVAELCNRLVLIVALKHQSAYTS